MIETAARKEIDSDALEQTDRIDFLRSYAFMGVHILALASLFTGVSIAAVGAMLITFWARLVRDYRRVSPLPLTPIVQDKPGLSVRPGVARRQARARTDRCGGFRTTGTITGTPTPETTSIHPA